jgi:hypothetical protein
MRPVDKAKYYLLGGITSAVLVPLAINATDSIQFSDGDVISATVINQLFAEVNKAVRLPTPGLFVGTWNCKEVIAGTYVDVITNNNTNWTIDDSGGFVTRDNVWTFASAAGNMLLISTTSGQPFQLNNSAFSSEITLAPDTRLLAFNSNGALPRQVFHVFSVTDTRFDIAINGSGQDGNSATCYKQNIPPAAVNNLAATVAGTNVTLAWSDSDTETGYRIESKTSISGGWTQAATPSTNSVSATVGPLGAGTYWFRIFAVNTYGSSLSSSEVLVTIQ